MVSLNFTHICYEELDVKSSRGKRVQDRRCAFADLIFDRQWKAAIRRVSSNRLHLARIRVAFLLVLIWQSWETFGDQVPPSIILTTTLLLRSRSKTQQNVIDLEYS